MGEYRFRFIRGMLSFIVAVGCTASAWAWSFPMDLSPVAMKFKHGYTGTAMDIPKRGTTAITVPEYYVYTSRNEPCAYVRGSSPKVLAQFWCSTADTPPITIDAVPNTGSTLELADKAMTFNPGSGFSHTDPNYLSETNYQMFDTATGFPNAVNKHHSWVWRVVAVNGVPVTPYTLGTTSHTVFALLDTPSSFYYNYQSGKPWADVLNLACDWAEGQTTMEGCVAALTEGLYEYTEIEYNYGADTYNSGVGQLYLNSLLNEIDSSSSPVPLDCRSYANLLCLLAYSVGIPYSNSESSGLGFLVIDDSQLGRIDTKVLHPAPDGTTSRTFDWDYHQIVYFYNSVQGVNCIADAAAKPDNSVNPILAKGNTPYGTYLQLLTTQSPVYITRDPSLGRGKALAE